MMFKVFVASATTLSMALSVSAQLANCARNYTVQPGDVCDAISAANHVSTFQLAHVNTFIDVDCTNLFVGEILCLGIVGQDCSTTTVVQEGNTCPSIEAAASIPASTLFNNNPNINADCSNIYPGEVLCTSFEIINYS
ncbi:hypothetical protein PNOK_0669900 [Pyrrhoderma noxium]|uniref:LysM domain-containing protein n=1 Tax=Pyrrhoderma noxium TaxID=2282107 RepID=A0A286UF31_9AGAM|nr:hypothetical protein PNOK_0669900 [Pyrrhoderma noxium]